MTLPAGGPATREDVKIWLSIPAEDVRQHATLDLVVAAVNAHVRGLPVAQKSDTDPAPEAWPANVKLGAAMLAAKVQRRRNTPGGVELLGEQVAYVTRNDPEVAMLLELGTYGRPAVG